MNFGLSRTIFVTETMQASTSCYIIQSTALFSFLRVTSTSRFHRITTWNVVKVYHCRVFLIDLIPNAMANFRKSLRFDEVANSSSSESDHEENWLSENQDLDLSPPAPKKQRRRQSKPPAKLREYNTEGSNIDNISEDTNCNCKCISAI